MDSMSTETSPIVLRPFYEQPGVETGRLSAGGGTPYGIQRVANLSVGIAGAYGTWGACYDNLELIEYLKPRLGDRLTSDNLMDLASLGFVGRHHLPTLPIEEHRDIELEIGVKILQEAILANEWEPGEVDGILIGMTGPVTDDYLEIIAARAGIPDKALKVSVHKACDSSVAALHLMLNPSLAENRLRNIAEELQGKKVLVGGIEGLSRLVNQSRDVNALQLFGNGTGILGIVPGKTVNFLVGKEVEVYDEEGVLQVRMNYPFHPHPGLSTSEGDTSVEEFMVEVTQAGEKSLRVAGYLHEPASGESVAMAGPMGMVKLFVRTGVQVVRDVYQSYQTQLDRLGQKGKAIQVAIVHHANLKINTLKDKQLQKEGIRLAIPWLLSDFGNVSAASNMIAFLRQLPSLKPGDHVLFDGFGAGTYYDVFVISLGG